MRNMLHAYVDLLIMKIDSSHPNFEVPRTRWEAANLTVAACRITDVTSFELLSQTQNSSFIVRYLANVARNPDKGSKFEKHSANLLSLPDKKILKLLFSSGYGALVYHSPEGDVFPPEVDIFGYVAFQIRNTGLYMFSVKVEEPYRGYGLSSAMMTDLIGYGRSNPNISEIQLGAGGHPTVQKFCEHVSAYSETYSLEVIESSRFRYLESQ